jgi:hypothetical protein
MINDIAIVIILVLIGIGALISMFLLGRWVEYKQHLESNKLTDEVYNRCLQLDRENKYLKIRVGLNKLTEDMGGK